MNQTRPLRTLSTFMYVLTLALALFGTIQDFLAANIVFVLASTLVGVMRTVSE